MNNKQNIDKIQLKILGIKTIDFYKYYENGFYTIKCCKHIDKCFNNYINNLKNNNWIEQDDLDFLIDNIIENKPIYTKPRLFVNKNWKCYVSKKLGNFVSEDGIFIKLEKIK